MIKLMTAFEERKELTSPSAVRWLAQQGFGRPIELTVAQRKALPAFLESSNTTYGFLQRESFLAALQRFMTAGKTFDRDEVRRPKLILFVGGIDGKAELNFLRKIGWRGTAVITSYGPMSEELRRLPDRLPANMRARLRTQGHVDATRLKLAFTAETFDFAVWIGPTNDDNLRATADLVDLFVTSAGKLLNPGGAVIVIQDLKTPNFRKILELNGANFCTSVRIDGRTQTQHSEKMVRLEGREDHMVAFYFDDKGARIAINGEDKAAGVKLLDMILGAKMIPVPDLDALKKGKIQAQEKPDNKGQKNKLVGMIFEYANSMG